MTTRDSLNPKSGSDPDFASGPLKGIKVLELGTLIAGPFCGKTLAEFGAEVIKIEPPGDGDPLRSWRRLRNGTSLWWQVQSRNKRSITLDLRRPRARTIVRRLVARLRHRDRELPARHAREAGASAGTRCRSDNPELVMVRISGYGQTGPYRDRPGFGAIGEAMGGMRYLTGVPDRLPVRVGISIGDTLAALHGVIGVLTALHHRKATAARAR